MDTAVDQQGFQDDANDDDVYVPRQRKSKRRLVQLLNLRPSVWFRTTAVVGPPSSPTYVMEVEVDGQVIMKASLYFDSNKKLYCLHNVDLIICILVDYFFRFSLIFIPHIAVLVFFSVAFFR